MKNSKLILSAAVAVSAMFSIGAASAADLPVKAMPYAAPVPAFSWTGFYLGGHAGAGVVLDQGFFEAGLSADRHGVSGLAGGQIGFNYQVGMLVLGIEGEGFWSGMKATKDVFATNTLIESDSVKNKWDYDIAGRFGVAFDRGLVYGKAGWVFGGFEWNAPSIFTSNQGSATLDGLLVGVGLEYAFTNNWTAKFEYDYLGFNAKDATFTSSCPACTVATTSSFTHSVSAEKHIFKVGINYLFNAAAPVFAKY